MQDILGQAIVGLSLNKATMNTYFSPLSDSDLAQKYFSFLESFEFIRTTSTRYERSKLQINIEFNETTSIGPVITFWIKSEPKFTRVELDWLFKEDFDYKKIGKHTSEEAVIAEYAAVLHNHIENLINNPDKLYLKGLKRRFVNIIKSNGLTKENYLNNIPPSASNHFHYIKNKDRKWDPAKDM